MSDFLLEIFTEEIPARMQQDAETQLTNKITEFFQQEKLYYSNISSFSTPRRLAIIASGLKEQQDDQLIERRGPKTDAPENAINGFMQSVGVGDISELEVRISGKAEHYFYISKNIGKKTKDIISAHMSEILASFSWPKSMRWGDGTTYWARPIRSICAIFDNETIRFSFAGVNSGNITSGHRFLSPKQLTITSPAEYEQKLLENHVTPNRAKRKEKIKQDITAILAQENLHITDDDWKLLDEVTGLVEYPVVLQGQFDDKYLSLPPEVLSTVMLHHQKYFPLYDKTTGKISSNFIFVANIGNMHDKNSAENLPIISGNEKVLKARFADAQYFWQQDRKSPLIASEDKLDKVIFQQKLGTIANKVARMRELSKMIALWIPHCDLLDAERACRMSKIDLASEMVGEFSDLQGIMGSYYAHADGEKPEIARAIREHYLPAGIDDDIPTLPISVAVALADKIDTLAGMFVIGKHPTGSRDPFALRRAALGIIRIILQNKLHIPLILLCDTAIAKFPPALFKQHDEKPKLYRQNVKIRLIEFIIDRLKIQLKGSGIRPDLINAVFAGGKEDNLTRLVSCVQSLEKFLATSQGAELLSAYKRANNIVTKAISSNPQLKLEGKIDSHILTLFEEKQLHDSLQQIGNRITKYSKDNLFYEAMQEAASLNAHVDAFFNNVTVNCADRQLRRNRLMILAQLHNVLSPIADFSQIQYIEMDNNNDA